MPAVDLVEAVIFILIEKMRLQPLHVCCDAAIFIQNGAGGILDL